MAILAASCGTEAPVGMGATATPGASAKATTASAMHTSAGTSGGPASVARAEASPAQPPEDAVVAPGFIVDGEHGLIYARAGHGSEMAYPEPPEDAALRVIDQATLAPRSTRSVRGLLALDGPNRRVFLDDVTRGVQVLDADSLAERRFIPLAPPPVARSDWPPTPAPVVPLADDATGTLIVGRGCRLLVIDPATGEVTRSIGDAFCDEGRLERSVIDVAGRRIHLTRRLADRDCYRYRVAVETYDLDTGRLLDRQAACHLDVLAAWDGQMLLSEHEGKPGPSHVRRLQSGRVLAEATGGPLPDGVRDAGRGRLFATIGAGWGGPGLLYWFDDRSLSPMGWMELPEGSVASGYDPVRDIVYLHRNGAIVALPAAEVQPQAPLAELPTTRLTRIPGRFFVRSDGISQFTVGIARGLTNPRDRGACRRDRDAWGWVLRRAADPSWRVVDAALPCQIDSGPWFHPAPTFPSDGRALVSTQTASGDGLHRTLDGGRSWRPAMVGLDNRDVQDVRYSPTFGDDDTVYLTTTDGRAWRSRDFGASWQPIGDYAGLTAAPTLSGSRIFAIARPGNAVHASSDGGGSWSVLGSLPVADDRVEAQALQVLAAPPDAPPVLLALAFRAGGPDHPWPNGDFQAFRSVDGGLRWTVVSAHIAWFIDVRRALVGPLGAGTQATWLLERSSGDAEPPRPRFLRSDDLGATWYPVDLPASLRDAPVAAAPDGQLIVARSVDDFSALSLDDLVRTAP